LRQNRVRWYLVYGLSLRNLEEMMAERGVTVDHAAIRRWTEQDHRAVKRRVRPMLGFKSTASARVILGAIEMIHMMRKQQAKYACTPRPSLAKQFDLLAA
jgi:transposase-like protein